MIEYSHSLSLVLASIIVALMAGFTGLSLTKGISDLPVPVRKLMIVLSAISLGMGIWAMHFVGMLGLQLPIHYYYDAAYTLASALIAILISGLALLILHFRPRTRSHLGFAGATLGSGIVAMHYTGMAGMQLCRPIYSLWGTGLTVLIALAAGILAITVAYGERTRRRIVLGTIVFGGAVTTVHYSAMGFTGFVQTREVIGFKPALENASLALLVICAVFVICGAFLLSSVTFLAPGEPTVEEPQAEPDIPRLVRLPYERDGQTLFVDGADVAAIRAEGPYTILYSGSEKFFCPWSISQAEKRLPEGMFVRTHRSYLVNGAHVAGFERKKDNGICTFIGTGSLSKVPVSRSRLSTVRKALGV